MLNIMNTELFMYTAMVWAVMVPVLFAWFVYWQQILAMDDGIMAKSIRLLFVVIGAFEVVGLLFGIIAIISVI